MITDNPIVLKAEDALHRTMHARVIADKINRYDGNESLVIGIEGEWGSGKTSFINFILEDLNLANALIIKFNPWNFSDQNELITDFFNSLIHSFETNNDNKSDERIQKIQDYSSKLLKKSEITVAPEFSFIGFHFKVGEVYKIGGDDPLETQKETINQLITSLGKRIIIVIDDIDRLDSNETKLIFKLVKITANFSNTIFLLAYDRCKVCDRITENGIEGEEFLKKIIQMPFPLPKPEPLDLYEILSSGIEGTFKGYKDKFWDDVEWGNLFHGGLKNLFTTVRDIKRYINSLTLDMEIIGIEEVNQLDFLGIEAVRVFAPEVFLAMADNKPVFTSIGSRLGLNENQYEENQKELIENIITNKSPKNIKEIIRKIIRHLFPQVDGLYSNHSYPSEMHHIWRQQLKVCSEDIYDKYFYLSITSTVLSEKKLTELINSIYDNKKFFGYLEEFHKEKKLRYILDRLVDCLEGVNYDQKQNLLAYIYDFVEKVIDIKRGMFDVVDIDSLTLRLGYQTLKRVSQQHRRVFIIDIFNRVESVFHPSHLVYTLDKYSNEKNTTVEEILLTKDEINELKRLCLAKIIKASKLGSLSKNKGLSFLLFRWKEWESDEAVKCTPWSRQNLWQFKV